MFTEEPFEDYNSNGIWDEGEDFTDLNNNDDWDGNLKGIYNQNGKKELGTNEDRSILDELKENTYNFGIEYNYSKKLSLRCGYHYDNEDDIKVPTMGLGYAINNFTFDFAYTGGAKGLPLSNTMYFSFEFSVPNHN